ncbi:hypothetical protein V1514DRAFT_339039 [Lipomyces japonicus]|uniref:uncharacterized protein n=1 Tax=Lipomyces japonicus TaxID=56871 RepID=UPI0034CD438A
MRLTRQLFMTAKLTLFTRAGCGLCDEAKRAVTTVISNAAIKPVYAEVDIDNANHRQWFDKYAFDVPVLHWQNDEGKTGKIMHHIGPADVRKLLST